MADAISYKQENESVVSAIAPKTVELGNIALNTEFQKNIFNLLTQILVEIRVVSSVLLANAGPSDGEDIRRDAAQRLADTAEW